VTSLLAFVDVFSDDLRKSGARYVVVISEEETESNMGYGVEQIVRKVHSLIELCRSKLFVPQSLDNAFIQVLREPYL
jgi:hypothetical protein